MSRMGLQLRLCWASAAAPFSQKQLRHAWQCMAHSDAAAAVDEDAVAVAVVVPWLAGPSAGPSCWNSSSSSTSSMSCAPPPLTTMMPSTYVRAIK